MTDSSEGFEEYLENVLCMLEGKGFKIRLESEQKKAGSCRKRFVDSTLYILKCELSMAKSTVSIYRTNTQTNKRKLTLEDC